MEKKIEAKLKKWRVTNINTGKSIDVAATTPSKAVDIAAKKLNVGSENEYSWRQI